VDPLTFAVVFQLLVTLGAVAAVGYVVDVRAKKRDADLRAYVSGMAREWKASAARVDAALKLLAAAERATPTSLPPPTLQ
jgi:hypothetical protein